MLVTKGLCNVAQNADDLEQIARRLETAGQIGYDSETNGLDPATCHIVGHVLTFGPTPPDTYYVPVRHEGGGNIERLDDFEDELRRHAQDPSLLWFGHNFQFDLKFMAKHRIIVRGMVEDTQVNQAVVNELSPSFSLDGSCRAMGAIEKKGEELYQHLSALFGGPPDRSSMQFFYKLSGQDPVGTDYATGDGVSTWDLRVKQWERFEQENLLYIANLERRVTRVVYRMQLRGIRIDMDALDQVDAFAKVKVKEAEKTFPKDFNTRSSRDIEKWLRAEGVTKFRYTPKGEEKLRAGDVEGALKHLQFNEDFLKDIPQGRMILAARKYANLGSTFITPLRERHVRADGRVHCTYYQMAGDDFGTITGRFSCTDPNLQQVPKRNRELGLPFRRVFVPNVGSQWLTADLSQCEPRILAHFSKARALVEGYTAKPFVDAHAAVTISAGPEAMLGVTFKEAREFGKRLNQTLLTGGGQRRIISMLGERGADIYEAYFDALPEVKKLLKDAEKRQAMRGYIISYLGRRARLASRNEAYKAANRIFQCGNADIIKQALADMDDYYESEGDVVTLLNTVHDSVDIDVPEGYEQIAINGLDFLCQFGPGRNFHLNVPMAAEWAMSSNWGDATYTAEQHVLGAEVDDPSLILTEVIKPPKMEAPNGGE